MIDYLKKWYVHTYQPIVYAISIARAEYDKVGSFITPSLLVLAVLKLYFNVPSWVVPTVVLVATTTAYWVGKWLIKLGVPKKSTQLGNQQNPELMEVLNWIRNHNV